MSSSKPGDDVARALAALIRYTRAGVRSTRQVLAYLQQRGVSSDTAVRTVRLCQARGILDDRACARLWADHWARQGYAWAAIRQKLTEKGLDDSTIDDATHRLGLASDDGARARLVVAQRIRLPAPRSRQAGRGAGRPPRARLARTLASRGFDSELIERVLDESFGTTPSDAER